MNIKCENFSWENSKLITSCIIASRQPYHHDRGMEPNLRESNDLLAYVRALAESKTDDRRVDQTSGLGRALAADEPLSDVIANLVELGQGQHGQEIPSN